MCVCKHVRVMRLNKLHNGNVCKACNKPFLMPETQDKAV